MNHVMIDTETWGTAPGCAIRSIGAVVFDPATGRKGDAFYRNITDDSNERAGLTRTASTVAWWADPERAEAQAHLLVDQVPLVFALQDFRAWYAARGCAETWSYGANADLPWLEAALAATMQPAPWHYRSPRCARTIVAVAGVDPDAYRIGTHHNALDDALAQVDMVHAAYVALGLAEEVADPRLLSDLISRGAPRAA